MLGKHVIKTWSSTQALASLSSGEADLVAVVKAVAESIGISRMAHDWGNASEGVIHVDSSTAAGMVQRRERLPIPSPAATASELRRFYYKLLFLHLSFTKKRICCIVLSRRFFLQ